MPADYSPPKRSTQIGNAKKKSKSKPSGFNPLLLWGGIGGAVLLVIAIVIAVMSNSGPATDVAVVTPNVEPDTTQPDVPPPLPKPKAKAFSERAAAEWVVSVGGRVRVLEPGRNSSYDVYTSGALPKGDFRVESLGLDAKVGIMQRPERVALLSAPQAFFGLALNGWVLAGIVTLLSVTAWITAVQRILFVYNVTRAAENASEPMLAPRSHNASSASTSASVTDDVPAPFAP